MRRYWSIEGYVFITSLLVMSLLLVAAVSVTTVSFAALTGGNRSTQNASALSIAEAGVEDVMQQLNRTTSPLTCAAAGSVNGQVFNSTEQGKGEYSVAYAPEPSPPAGKNGCLINSTGRLYFPATSGTAASIKRIKVIVRGTTGGGGGVTPGVITKVAEYGTTATGTSITLNKPTSVQEADVMVLTLTLPTYTPTFTAPAGWSLAANVNYVNGGKISTYYKVAGASEPANYTFTISTSSPVAGLVMAYRGAYPALIEPPTTRTNASTTTINATGVTLNDSNMMLVGFWQIKATATLTPNAAITPNATTLAVGGVSLRGGNRDAGAATYASSGLEGATSSVSGYGSGVMVALTPRQPDGTPAKLLKYSSHFTSSNTTGSLGQVVSAAIPGGNYITAITIVAASPGGDINAPAGCNVTKYREIDAPNLTTAYFWATHTNSCTYTVSPASEVGGRINLVYRWADRTNPILADGYNLTSGTSHSTPSLGLSQPGTHIMANLVSLFANGSPGISPSLPAGMIDEIPDPTRDTIITISPQPGDPYGQGIRTAGQNLTSSGATGPRTFTTNASSPSAIAYILGLRNEVPPGPYPPITPSGWKVDLYQRLPD